MKPFLILIACGLAMPSTSGCFWPFVRRPPPQPAPHAFEIPPTLERVIQVVNGNTAQVRQLQTEVKVKMEGLPQLSGDLALERPRRFRMKAGLLGITATGVDMGSNDEAFWVWIKQSLDPRQPVAVYYARHDQFAQSSMRRLIPIEPDWLIEALGVVYLDPYGQHEGPFERGQNRLEIRSRVATAEGESTKVTIVHDKYGWILEQHMYDGQGQWVASARGSEHRFYPHLGVTLPQRVELALPQAGATGASVAGQLSIELELAEYSINQLVGDPAQLWSIPRPRDVPMIDLANPGIGPAPNDQPPVRAPQPNRNVESPYLGYRPQIRGMLR